MRILHDENWILASRTFPPYGASRMSKLYRSNRGFTIEIVSSSKIRYSEEGRYTEMEYELLDNPLAFAIFVVSLTNWSSPPEPILPEEKETILRNLLEIQ